MRSPQTRTPWTFQLFKGQVTKCIIVKLGAQIVKDLLPPTRDKITRSVHMLGPGGNQPAKLYRSSKLGLENVGVHRAKVRAPILLRLNTCFEGYVGAAHLGEPRYFGSIILCRCLDQDRRRQREPTVDIVHRKHFLGHG